MTRPRRLADREPTLNDDSRASLALVLIALGAFCWFALPPSYIAVGPFSVGAKEGDCHGITQQDSPPLVEVCK